MVWTQLNKQFIGRLNQEGQSMATKIETNILKLYLITATRQNKPDEVKAFFEKNSDSLQYRKEWKDWFGKLTVYPRRRDLACYSGPVDLHPNLPCGPSGSFVSVMSYSLQPCHLRRTQKSTQYSRCTTVKNGTTLSPSLCTTSSALC